MATIGRLAATDGLTELVHDDAILKLYRKYRKAPSLLGASLIEQAKRMDGHDNITVAIMSLLA